MSGSLPSLLSHTRSGLPVVWFKVVRTCPTDPTFTVDGDVQKVVPGSRRVSKLYVGPNHFGSCIVYLLLR